MATKVRVKKKIAVKAKTVASRKKAAANNGKLTVAERHRLAKCIAPKDDKCPAVNGKDSAFMYQQGCRAEPCRLANKAYYREYRARKAAEATKAARKRKAAAKKRAATKKPVAKKTAAKKKR